MRPPPRLAFVPRLPSHSANRYSRPLRLTWASPSKPLFSVLNCVSRRVQRTKRPAVVVLGDETPEQPVDVFQRLDQAEHAPAFTVDGDVLEARPQARRGQEPIRVRGARARGRRARPGSSCRKPPGPSLSSSSATPLASSRLFVFFPGRRRYSFSSRTNSSFSDMLFPQWNPGLRPLVGQILPLIYVKWRFACEA